MDPEKEKILCSNKEASFESDALARGKGYLEEIPCELSANGQT